MVPGMDSDRPVHSAAGTGNPWQGFAHPDHRAEHFDALLRTLRFASIQLGKFWVEFNSFPVFMNEMKGTSIRQIERLFDWFQAAPSWSGRVRLPRLVPELHQAASRERLLEFTSRVVRARTIRSGIAQALGAKLSSEAELEQAIAHLDAAGVQAEKLGLGAGGLAETVALIQQCGDRLERNGKVQAFFSSLAVDCALGVEAGRASECLRVFQAVEIIRHTPLSVWQWRRPQCLAAQNRVRILAWQDRSTPLLEARKRLEPRFKMQSHVAAAQLRLLSEKILAGGLWRRLGSEYKNAIKRYRELLRTGDGDKSKAPASPPLSKVSRAEMAAQLTDWADYLERKAQVEESAEARALFSPHFRGIDTQFEAALEANAWATSIRGDLESEDKGSEADFTSRLVDQLLSAPQEKLLQSIELCSGAKLQAVQAILALPDYAANREFAAVGCDEEARWLDATQLRELLAKLDVLPGVRLSQLAVIRGATSELLTLVRAIEAQPEPRAAFKQMFAGEGTDLGLLADAQDYIDFVRASGLSDGLKASFLTAHGPQRLQDTRALVAPALAGLSHVKEHLRRLEAATHGQSRQLEELPLLDLIQTIQLALKQPALLGEIVANMQRMRVDLAPRPS